ASCVSGASVGASGPISASDPVSTSDIVYVVGKDRLLPVRPHGNDFHGPAHQRAEPIEIVAGPSRQAGNAADVADFFPPAGHRFVDGNDPPQVLDVIWEIHDPLAVELVGGANL